MSEAAAEAGGAEAGKMEQDAPRGLVGYFARNHVAANALMLLFLGGGLVAANLLVVERHPEYDPRTVTVTVPYPGAAPAEVEAEITKRVEENLTGIIGVQRVVSRARAGVGTVTAEYGPFADAVEVLNAVRTAVERIENFPPPNADQPEIVRSEVVRKVLSLAVSAPEIGEDDLRLDAEALRSALLELPNVSVVELRGARDREIQIELSEEDLRRHQLGIDQVVALVRQSSFNLSGGELRTEAGDIAIGTLAKRVRAEEFEDIVLVARPDGTVVRLRDVATVRDGFVERDLVSEIDGRPAVFLRVASAAGQSTQEVADEVKAFLAAYQAPPGTDIAVWQDEGLFISERVSTVARNALIGALLVFFLLLALFDLRFALWIAMGIPIAFLGSMVFFDPTGMTINVLTLFAFFIVTGLVVDDAVVVGESIARQRELGLRGAAASVAGVRAVSGPVAVGALTTAVTFFALYPLGDAWGQLVRVMPVVIALVLAVSLAEAFCILPGHLAGERPWSRSPLAEWQAKARSLLDDFVLSRVVRVIALAVRFPLATVGTVLLGVLLAAGLVASGAAPYTSFPSNVGGDRLQAEVTMPAGTRFAVTAAAAERLAAAAGAVDRQWDGKVVDAVAVHVGGHRPLEHYTGIDEDPVGSHLAAVEVKLKPAAERVVSIVDFERLWQRAAGEIAGARQVSFKAAAALASSSVSHVLLHDDGDVLARAVADLARAYAGMDGVHEVDDSLALGKRRFDVRLSDAGVAAGLTAANVAGELRAAFFGAEVQRVQRGSEEIRVVVRYPGERRRSLQDLLDERVSLPGGGRAPLATVAHITEVRDYAEQVRIDGRRAATVTAWFDVAATSAGQVSTQVEEETLPTLLARHPGLEAREHGTTRELTAMAETLRWTFPLALLVVYGLLAAQLRSFAQPLLALASVPLALVGTVVGHLLLDYELTNMSLFGIVGVSGVVVNDTLLLLDRYNRIRREDANLPAIAAISAAARHRARAIVLTTLTTVIGLAPMLYDKSEAIQFLVPMVISLGAGLVFASMGVLFLVPAVLILVEMARYSRVGLALFPGKAAA